MGIVSGGCLHMAFLASIVFAFAGLALLHGALASRRIAASRRITASSYRFFLPLPFVFFPLLRTMHAKESVLASSCLDYG